MTNEKKAPKVEDVERDAIRVTDAIAAQTGAPAGAIVLDHAALARLKAQALLGVQVPGLVADNAELLERLDEAVQLVAVYDAEACVALEVPDENDHPGTALLAEHEAKVYALQARVTELEAFIQRGREQFTRHITANAEYVWALQAERDALRAQVAGIHAYLKAEHTQHMADAERAGNRGNVVHLLKAQVITNAIRALSTPPAEENKPAHGEGPVTCPVCHRPVTGGAAYRPVRGEPHPWCAAGRKP